MKMRTKIALIFSALLVMVIWSTIANNSNTASPVNRASADATEEDYSNMTNPERVQMRTDMKADQVESQNMVAAAYLQGRIDHLNE